MTLNPLSGTLFSDIITYVRRIIKSPSSQAISDATIGDYINRFYVYDMPARLQLFELKRQYTFETQANTFIYQAPETAVTDENAGVVNVPQYQTFDAPAYCDGVQMGWYLSNQQFYNIFPEFVNNQQPILGTNSAGPYTITLSTVPILPGFRDDLDNLQPYLFITAVDGTGKQNYVVDDGLGNLIRTDSSFQFGPSGPPSPPVNTGTINYIAGALSTFSFDQVIPSGNPITIQTSPYSAGRPRICLFFNNTFKLYPVPDRAYKIQVDAYITPSAFLNTSNGIPFAYMSSYLSKGAARKILIDNADYEQFEFYERFFKEEEISVLRRTERQRAGDRTATIFSASTSQSPYFFTQY